MRQSFYRRRDLIIFIILMFRLWESWEFMVIIRGKFILMTHSVCRLAEWKLRRKILSVWKLWRVAQSFLIRLQKNLIFPVQRILEQSFRLQSIVKLNWNSIKNANYAFHFHFHLFRTGKAIGKLQRDNLAAIVLKITGKIIFLGSYRLSDLWFATQQLPCPWDFNARNFACFAINFIEW